MSYGHFQVDFLSPPLEPVEQVSVERSERGDVENLHPGGLFRISKQPCENWKHCRLRLSAGRRGDQKNILSLKYGRDCPYLGFCGLSESFLPSSLNQGLGQKLEDTR